MLRRGALIGERPRLLDYERLTRYTARVSFLFFLPVFTLSALSHFLRHPAVLALRPRRRQLGITFGIAHLCHFGAILLFHQHQGTWFTADDSAALFIYALLGVQVATSNTPAARALGKLWRPTHWVASYALLWAFLRPTSDGSRRPARSSTSCFSVSLALPGPSASPLSFQSAAPGPWKQARRFSPALSKRSG